MIPWNEQNIIISAICYAEDHYANPLVYAQKAIEKEDLQWTESHEEYALSYMYEND